MQSNQNTLKTQLEQFFESQQIEIESEFIERFIHNIVFEDISVSSEWLYAWYKSTGYKSRYYEFCKRVITQLPETEYKILNSNLGQDKNRNTNGQILRELYEVSQLGVNLVMMQFDSQVRLYYAKCEQLLKQFFKQHLTQINQELEQTNNLLDKCKRKCTIYKVNIFDDKEEQIEFEYVGSSEQFNRRKQQHLKSSSNPLVKQYVEQGRKCQVIKLHEFEYNYKEQRAIIEQQYINQIDSSKKLNLTNAVIQDYEEEKNDNIIKCINCTKPLLQDELNNKSCSNCLQSQKKSKKKRSQQQLSENQQFCNRCSQVRLISNFQKDGQIFKTCDNCRLRNRTKMASIQKQNITSEIKLCIVCHNDGKQTIRNDNIQNNYLNSVY